MKKCKMCKKPMAVVKAFGKMKTRAIGWYCFKDQRFVPDPTKVKSQNTTTTEELI